MVRIARVVVPDIPHHVTQRGNRNQQVFFSDQDRRLYLNLIRTFSKVHGVEIWAYCLMDNHVHFVAVPGTTESLRRCFQEVHQIYTRSINLREGWRGCLWQGRFSSFPMDERYLVAAIRYVECNPVRAHIVEKAEDYPWSSAKAHVRGVVDDVVSRFYLLDEIKNWGSFLRESDSMAVASFGKAIRSGRPLGSSEFLERLEKDTGRVLREGRRGPKKRVSLVP